MLRYIQTARTAPARFHVLVGAAVVFVGSVYGCAEGAGFEAEDDQAPLDAGDTRAASSGGSSSGDRSGSSSSGGGSSSGSAAESSSGSDSESSSSSGGSSSGGSSSGSSSGGSSSSSSSSSSSGGGAGQWECPPAWYEDYECDCGCGIPDPDCEGSTSSYACYTCSNCSADEEECFYALDPDDNSQCL